MFPKRRIALLAPTHPFRGGISHYSTLLAKALVEQEHELLFISFRRMYPAFLFPGASDRETGEGFQSGCNVEYLLDSMNPTTWWTTAFRICRYRPDVLIVPWWTFFWAVQFRSVCRYIRKHSPATEILFLCHNVIDHEACSWKRSSAKWVLRLGHRFIVHSQHDKEELLNLLPDANVAKEHHPTYAAFDAREVSPSELQDQRERLHIPGKCILFFGFIRPYKGLDLLLRAMPAVLKQRELTLLIVGEFWEDRKPYDELIEKLNISHAVRVLDEYVPNDQVPIYVNLADLVVLPYRSGTGSGVAQIAFGFGKPVVASEVGSLSEIVENGVNGVLIPPEHPEALADALVRSLDERTLQNLTAGADQAKERFSWERMVEAITAPQLPAGDRT